MTFPARSVVWLWLSRDGRATRSDFWIRFVFLALAILVPIYLLDAFLLGSSGLLVNLWQVVLLWPIFAVGIKRFHDRDRSGRPFVFLMLAFLAANLATAAAAFLLQPAIRAGLPLPIAGSMAMGMASLAGVAIAIYLLIALGIRRGTEGANRYGPDPTGKARGD